ncbi:hypothetical protein OUHCRE5_51560 [Enterobacter asburiae]
MIVFLRPLGLRLPKDNTWYAGAKLGWSQYHDVGNNQINNAGPTHKSDRSHVVL